MALPERTAFSLKLRKKSLAPFSFARHPRVFAQPSYNRLHSSFCWSIPLSVLSGQGLLTVPESCGELFGSSVFPTKYGAGFREQPRVTVILCRSQNAFCRRIESFCIGLAFCILIETPTQIDSAFSSSLAAARVHLVGVYQTNTSKIDQDPESEPDSAGQSIGRRSHPSTFPEVLVGRAPVDIVRLHSIVQWI